MTGENKMGLFEWHCQVCDNNFKDGFFEDEEVANFEIGVCPRCFNTPVAKYVIDLFEKHKSRMYNAKVLAGMTISYLRGNYDNLSEEEYSNDLYNVAREFESCGDIRDFKRLNDINKLDNLSFHIVFDAIAICKKKKYKTDDELKNNLIESINLYMEYRNWNDEVLEEKIKISESSIDKAFEKWYNDPNDGLFSTKCEYLTTNKRELLEAFKQGVNFKMESIKS